MKLDSVLLLTFLLLGVTCGISEAPDVHLKRLMTIVDKRQRHTESSGHQRHTESSGHQRHTESSGHQRHTESSGHQRHSIELRRGITNAYESDNSKQRDGTTRPNVRHIADVKTLPNGDIEKTYAPKEDPREYYQSESYLRYALTRNDIATFREMSSVYPELEPRLERMRMKTQHLRNLHKSSSHHSDSDYNQDICLECPAERTLVMRLGVDKVLLQSPQLQSCSGERPPRGARFVRSHGPVFGSLVGAGSHVIFGRLVYNGHYLQSCRFRVHVASRMCPVPPHLRAQCDSIRCNFTCADPALQLIGTASLICGDGLRWSGAPPVCRGRTWCYLPQAPSDGELSCRSLSGDSGAHVSEGSRCRARCRRGRRAVPRGFAVCRRGAWTVALACKKHRQVSGSRLSRNNYRKR